MKKVIVGVFIAIGVVALTTGFATLVSVITAPSRVVQKTMQTDNIISNYEWFEKQYRDIQAIDIRLTANKALLQNFEGSAGDRTNWSFEDKIEHARISTIVVGLTGQKADMIAKYNARSAMANRNIFKSGNLPERIESE